MQNIETNESETIGRPRRPILSHSLAIKTQLYKKKNKIYCFHLIMYKKGNQMFVNKA